MSVMAGIMYAASKFARSARLGLEDDVARDAFDVALRILALEILFALVAVFLAVVAIVRREGRWAVFAVFLGVVFIGLRFAYM
jgi:hypothetical protein